MNVADIAIKDVITVNSDDSISKALSKMQKHKIHQLPVTDGDSLSGMLLLNHLLGRDYDPSKAKVKNFMINVPYLEPGLSLDDAIQMILKSGLRALPVISKDNLSGILSETDVIKHVKFLKDINPKNLMSPSIIIAASDNLEKALSIMSQNNISRLPVVDFDNKVMGCLDILGLIKFLSVPTESPRYSEVTAKEKEYLSAFGVKDEMRNTFLLEEEQFSLKKVIEALQQHEEVVLTRVQQATGVIVPKDVLELSRFGQEYPLEVSHLKDVDQFEISKFQDMVARFMEKFEKMFNIQKLFIYADVHKKKEHGHRKFSFRAKLITDKKMYIAKSYGWDIKEATHMLLNSFEKQLLRNHEKQAGTAKRGMKYHLT